MIALYVFLCLMESGKKICFNKHFMFLECEVIDVFKKPRDAWLPLATRRAASNQLRRVGEIPFYGVGAFNLRCSSATRPSILCLQMAVGQKLRRAEASRRIYKSIYMLSVTAPKMTKKRKDLRKVANVKCC